MKKGVNIIVALLITSGVMMVSNGCRKIKDTKAEVYVRNEIGAPIPGAKVRLFGESSIEDMEVGEIRLDDTQYTNAEGKAVFDYTEYFKAGQAGFAVLTADIVQYLPPPDDSLHLRSIIKIEEEMTNIETYVLEEN